MSTVPVLPAASVTVTVTVAVPALAASGVPPMTPVTASMARPEGRPAAA